MKFRSRPVRRAREATHRSALPSAAAARWSSRSSRRLLPARRPTREVRHPSQSHPNPPASSASRTSVHPRRRRATLHARGAHPLVHPRPSSSSSRSGAHTPPYRRPNLLAQPRPFSFPSCASASSSRTKREVLGEMVSDELARRSLAKEVSELAGRRRGGGGRRRGRVRRRRKKGVVMSRWGSREGSTVSERPSRRDRS